MVEKNHYQPFLKSLRTAITNASVYFPEHPIFIKSIKELKIAIDQFCQLKGPLNIDITHDRLSFSGEKLDLSVSNENIISFFHQRKVKSLQINQGVSLEDLVVFLNKVSLPSKDILLSGGLSKILEEEGLKNIRVEDLDYSDLLCDETWEFKYSWFYLLKNSLRNNDTAQLKVLADNFEMMLEQIDLHNPDDLNELETVIADFFAYLRKNNAAEFLKCLTSFSKLLLAAPEGFTALQVDKLKDIYGNLSSDNLAAILFVRLEKAKELDSLNFKLFSQLIKRKQHADVAVSLAERLKKAKWIKNNPQALEKIQNIFSSPKDTSLSQVYRHSLSSILSTIDLGQGNSFDREILQENYRLMLLDLLNFESSPKRLEIIIDKILVEISKCFEVHAQPGEQAYLDKFIDIFEAKPKQPEKGLETFLKESDQKISSLLEKAAFSQKITFDFSRLISLVRKPASDSKFYLDKIFKEQIVNPYILQLFFKFFPQEVDNFYSQVQLHISQISFVKNVLNSLKMVEVKIALKVFKHIFNSSSEFIKLEVIKAMQTLASCDQDFLFSILNTRKTLFRQEAFKVIVKYPQLHRRLAVVLFSVSNPFGLRTGLLLENLGFLSQEYFNQAKPYLLSLANLKFFWNRAIRRKASAILAKYGS